MLRADRRAYAPGDAVALFVPCYVDVLFPEVGIATFSLLTRLGVRVEYPAAQTCCGQPAWTSGHMEEAAALARRFAGVFAHAPWIVVPSGSCGAMTRSSYRTLDPDGPAGRIGARVYDLASFLVDVLGVVDVGARFPHAVSYHDGCHGRRELGSTAAALRLLEAVDGIDLRPLPRIDECCGFGGLFSVTFDALSTSMGDAKCSDAMSTGAAYLASGDSSCLMHVGALLVDRGSKMRTIHLAQVLAAT